MRKSGVVISILGMFILLLFHTGYWVSAQDLEQRAFEAIKEEIRQNGSKHGRARGRYLSETTGSEVIDSIRTVGGYFLSSDPVLENLDRGFTLGAIDFAREVDFSRSVRKLERSRNFGRELNEQELQILVDAEREGYVEGLAQFGMLDDRFVDPSPVLDDRCPIPDIAEALGQSVEDLIRANPHLPVSQRADGVEYFAVNDPDAIINLPDGTQMAFIEFILRWMLELPLITPIEGETGSEGLIGSAGDDLIDDDLLDLLFVIDTTGSMRDDIAEVNRRAIDIINQVAANSPDWRIGIVTYRDHPQSPYGNPGDYVARLELEFSSNQNDIIAAINRIVVDGGGDGPEAVFAGLLEAIGQPWRNGARKVVILMGDAPPHDPDPILGYTSQTVLQAAYDVDPASIFPILIESQNAVRFPFQVLADGSSGRLFYASNANEVVPTLLSTIDIAAGIQLSIGLDVQIGSLEPDFPVRMAPSMRAGVVSEALRSEHATIIAGPQVVFEISDRNVPQNFIWWQVQTANGLEGWIQETYYGEPILIPFSEVDPVTPATCTLSTIRDVNIRSGPGTNYQQIASRAGEGQILAANGQFGNINVVQDHWWQLLDGFWIRDDQVRETGDCASLPMIAVP